MRHAVRWKVEKCGCLCDLEMGDNGETSALMVEACAEHKGIPDAAGILWRAVLKGGAEEDGKSEPRGNQD